MKAYKRNGVTGGTSTDLDYIDGDLLADQDFCMVLDDATGTFAPYELDADSGMADDGLNVIAPLTNAGTKRWIRRSMAELIKDVSNGVPGLTTFKINFMNALGTVTSFFTNANTAPRTYTFPDRDGTIVDNIGFPTFLNYHMPGSGGVSGYQKFKNGIVIQWGQVNTSAVGAWAAFPIAYTNVYAITATPIAGTSAAYIASIDAGSFQILSAGGATTQSWIAIGFITPA